MALTDVVARTAKPRDKAYKLADAHGLYLLVSPNGSKRWYLKYRFEGKESRIAFGAYPLVSLAKASEKRDEIRLLLLEGIHPTEKREEEKEQAQEALNTFAKVAQDWHRNISQNRWSETHAGRVWRDMERNLLPAIGHRHIADLKTKDLLEPLKVVEQNGHLDLASRLRQRVTDIMRFAVRNDLIERNPAQDLSGAIAVPKAVTGGLKTVYQAPTEEAALMALDTFAGAWDDKYPQISKSWRAHWENLNTFFGYPPDIRKAIYTTNAIESLNSVIRQAIKKRKVFPTDDSVRKVIDLAIKDASKNGVCRSRTGGWR